MNGTSLDIIHVSDIGAVTVQRSNGASFYYHNTSGGAYAIELWDNIRGVKYPATDFTSLPNFNIGGSR